MASRAIFVAANRYLVEQRRLHQKRVGVGIETVGLFVGRQQFRPIHLDPDQVAHRVGILGAIQAMHFGRPPRINVRCRGTIQFRFQPPGDRVVSGVIGPRHADRRHRTASQLDDYFLPGLGGIEDVLRIGRIQLDICGFDLLVMTPDAILVHQFPSGGRGRRGRRDCS